MDLFKRFESKYIVDETTGCWLWTAGLFSNGYGQFWFNGRTHHAHRISYLLYKGDIDDESLFVCHSCDVKICVNPAHLWLGTNSANQNDSIAKGRQKEVRKDTCPRGHSYAGSNLRIETSRSGGIARRCITCANDLRRTRRKVRGYN